MVVLQTVVTPLVAVNADGIDEDLAENLQHQVSVDKEKTTRETKEDKFTDEVEQLNKEIKPSKSDSSIDGVVDKSKEEIQIKEEVKPKESPKKEVKETKVERMTAKMVENIVEENSQRDSVDDTDIIPDAKVVIGDDGLHYYDGKPILIKDFEKPMGDTFRNMVKENLVSLKPKPKAIAQYESLAKVETEDLQAYLPKVFMDTYTTINQIELVPTVYAAQDNRIYNEGDAEFQGVRSPRWGNFFSFNDFLAFCIQRNLSSPNYGSTITEYGNFTTFITSETNRNRFFKAFYYGYGGPASIFGDTHEGKISDVKNHMSSNKQKASEGIILTSEVLSFVYQGKGSTTLTNLKAEPNFKKLYDIVFDDSIKISSENRFVKSSDQGTALGLNSKLSVSRKDGKQVTETVIFDSYPKNTVSIPVPSGVTLVNETTGVSTSGGGNKTVLVKGGDKFHFEASNSFNLNYKTGALASNYKVLQPTIIKTENSGLQNLGAIKNIDPAKNMHLNADFKPNTAKVRIGHTDTSKKDSQGKNTILEEKTETVTIGSTKTYCHKTNNSFSNGEKGVTYKPLTGCKTITVTEDTTVWLDYTTEWKLTVHLVDYHDNARIIKTTQNGVSKNYNTEVKFNYSASGDANNNFLVDRTKEREGRKVRYNYYSGGVDKTVNSKKMETGNQNFKMPRGNKTIYIPYQPRRNVTVIHKDMDEGKGGGLLDPATYIKERYENHPNVLKIDRAHIDKPVYVDGKTGKQYVYQGHKKDYKGSILSSNTAEFQPKKDDHVVEFLFRQQTGVEVIHKDLYTTTLLKPTQTTTGLRTTKKDFKAEKEITKDGKTYVYHGYKINKKGSILPESTYNHTYGTEGVTIEFLYKLKRTVTVNYLDFFTNKTVQPSLVETYLQKDKYSYTPLKTIMQDETNAVYHFFNATGDPQSGVVETDNLTINYNYKKEVTVVVEYKDKRTNKEIRDKKEYKVLQGDKINEDPPTIPYKKNDTRPNFNYRYIDSELKGINKYTNVVAGADDIHITHFYDVPLADVGLKKIQIYTAKAEDGLPVKVELSHVKNYPTSVIDMKNSNKTITLALYQGSKKLDSKKYTAEKIPTNVDFKISPNVLKVNENKPYTVKLEGFDSNDFKVVTSAATITTKGYTSSESLIEVNSSNVTDLSYTGVVMTEREVGKDMKEFYETIDLSFDKLKKMRTGYGFTMPLDMVYNNEIGSGSTDFSFNMLVPESIVDTKYIEYSTVKSNATVPLERTVDQTKVNNETKKVTQKYELQHVNVENRTGAIFSDAQVRANDKRIQYDMVDGERKFYLPIWSRVGQYPITVESADKLGVHQVDIKINYELNIFAHMMAHMDSETIQDDAILFIPIDKKTPFPEGIPEGWTQADIDWIQE